MLEKIFKDDGEHIPGGKSNWSGHRSAPRPCQAHPINIALCVSQHRKLEKNFDSKPTSRPIFWNQMPDEANCVSLDHNCWF